jgi:hypothetical protein
MLYHIIPGSFCIRQSNVISLPSFLFFFWRFIPANFADDMHDDPHGVGRVGMYSHTGREYAAADARWGTADSTVVSLELLTVFGAGPLAALIVYQIVKRDPARHYWIVVLSTAELYGGYVFLLPFSFSWGLARQSNE